MLKKLMKYDLKKMLKLLKWFYLISLCLALITRFFNLFNYIHFFRIIGAIFSGFAYAAIGNVIVNTFVHILMRFSHSFYKDESYLTHTLPVKKNTLLLSKYLSALIVIFMSILVSFLSLFIILYSPEFIEGIMIALNGIVSGLNISGGLFLFIITLTIFFEVCFLMSTAFTSIVLGYSYNRKRGLLGFLWFILFYHICSIVSLVAIILTTLITGDIFSLFASQMSPTAFMSVIMVGLTLYAIFSIVFYFICRKLFNRGVNVD